MRCKTSVVHALVQILIQECGEFDQRRFDDLDPHVRQSYVCHPAAHPNGVGCILHEFWARMLVKVVITRFYQLLVLELQPDHRVALVHTDLPDACWSRCRYALFRRYLASCMT